LNVKFQSRYSGTKCQINVKYHMTKLTKSSIRSELLRGLLPPQAGGREAGSGLKVSTPLQHFVILRMAK